MVMSILANNFFGYLYRFICGTHKSKTKLEYQFILKLILQKQWNTKNN